MSSSTIDLISPFSPLGKKHIQGLDAVIADIVAYNAGLAPPIEDLIRYVTGYLSTTYSITDISALDALHAGLSDCINSYLAGSSAGSIGFVGLNSVDVADIPSYLTRLEQSAKAAPSVNSPQASRLLALAIGKANHEYWNTQLNIVGSDWVNFFGGNLAIDTARMPYWIGAAMCGSTSGFRQVKACDSLGSTNHLVTALGGSILVGAGRIIYGWVPRIPVVSRRPIQPAGLAGGTGGVAQPNVNWACYDYCCDNGTVGSFEAENDTAAQQFVNDISVEMSNHCSLM